MANSDQDSTKLEITPASSAGSLISFDELDHFFDDFLSRRWSRFMDWNLPIVLDKGFPKVDILDLDNHIEVQAALPGVKKDDLEVSINNQNITIRSTIKTEEQKEEGKYFRREIARGEFQRTLSLPDNVDSENANAAFKDGLLKITIPKTDKSKRKTIKVE